MRGGTVSNAVMVWPPMGLSPLARGNRHKWAKPGSLIGSIPACAGEPHPFIVNSFLATVYPRLRGGTQRLDVVCL